TGSARPPHSRPRDAVQDKNRRKDEFLAMLSHELRNPLAPILNSLQILRLADLRDPTLVAARDVIDRQVRHLAGLVDGLLDVFGIVHHKVTLQRELLDLADLARRVADEYHAAVSAAGITFDLERRGGPVWIEGDQFRMKQVLGNLMQNAAKFSNAGDRITMEVAADVARQRATL